MKLENVRPMNFSGIPFALVVVAFSLIVILPKAVTMPERYWPLWILGWVILFASWGTGAEIEGDSIVLKYVFGKLKIRIPFSEIEEITTLNKLQKGTIAKYFKWEIFLFTIFVIYALFDLIILPRGLLRGYYFGDIGLIIFGLFYISVFTVPFSKKWIIVIFTYSLIPLEVFILHLKTGNITADDVFVLISTAFVLTVALWEAYSVEYVVIRTPKKLYLLTTKSADEIIKALLKVAQNV
ncbi:hypothetical protein [Thermococcus paralvinellae]|uniref:Uncharacterized protein n=1 Tax=Thermococcus paralvinellae TaxID=582419 RepID=W0I9S8_9EURY|nr:hypothetical protein [Thermococcus paralvinellae]AHF81183.1 Hypothetical protein TES1_1808 [Thermococcus paralvinellae]